MERDMTFAEADAAILAAIGPHDSYNIEIDHWHWRKQRVGAPNRETRYSVTWIPEHDAQKSFEANSMYAAVCALVDSTDVEQPTAVQMTQQLADSANVA